MNLPTPFQRAGIQQPKPNMRQRRVLSGQTPGPRCSYLHTRTLSPWELSRYMNNEVERVSYKTATQRFIRHQGVPQGPGFQSLLRENNKHMRKYLATCTSKRILLDNNVHEPLIVTHGAKIPIVRSGYTPTAVAGVGGHVGREQGKRLR